MGSTVAEPAEVDRDRLAAEIFDLLFELVGRMRGHFDEMAGKFDLPPASAKALLRLTEPVPMHQLATALQCDRSNVTGLIDSLEKRGLVERRVSDLDRRVKHIVTTPKGARTRRQLDKRLFEHAPLLSDLGQDDLQALAGILRRGLGPA